MDVSEVLNASFIALMIEAVNASEPSVTFYETTRCNVTEESHLHTLRSKKLKSRNNQDSCSLIGCKLANSLYRLNFTSLKERIF
jgi:hypothetical protein